MKKTLAIMLALIMVLAMVPALAETVETTGILLNPDPSSIPEITPDQPEPTWNLDISKSKSATALDANDQSKVTLSIPSAQENLASDVVFVLDGSSSAESGVVTAALVLLDNLKTAAESSGAAVKVCVVKFKRQAFKSGWFDLSTQYTNIKTAMETKYSGGTNIHAGLLAGKEALEEHTNVAVGRKYLILVSDGSTYLYSKDGNWASETPFTRSYYTKENYLVYAGGFNDQGLYNPSNGGPTYDEKNVARPTNTSDVAAWKAYLDDVKARNETINSEGKTGDDYDYHCEYKNNFETNPPIPSADFKSQPCEGRTANNRDMAFYYADQTWQKMKKAGYRLFSVATKDGSAGEGNANDSLSFMNYLNGGESFDFKEIESEINYAIGAGSTVEDKMGVDFDLVPGKFELTVGGKPLASKTEGTEGNVIYFGDDANGLSEKNYRFKVVYDSTNDMFTWTINENVSNFAPVKLTYTVQLVNKSTVSGTYTPPTNQYARLTPKNSNGDPGNRQEFNIPKVSYTVGGGSSGGGNGGGYYYPTTTPVPVIVIPPKTGDMTVWQSILHFLGIR